MNELQKLWNQVVQETSFGQAEEIFRSRARARGFSHEQIEKFLEELEEETTAMGGIF